MKVTGNVERYASLDYNVPPTTAATPAPLSIAVRKRRSDAFTLDVFFQAPPGVTMLFGPSGAGKTTLLDCVAGLNEPDTGRIAVGDRVLFDDRRGVNVPIARRGISYVFQTLALFPHMTVAANIAYALPHVSRPERDSRVDAILQSFRIRHTRHRRPADISGGERQRAALARALVGDPSVLLLDEPLSALDLTTKRAIIDDLRAWNGQHRIPILYVTHSRDEVFAVGEHVVAIDRGQLLAEGDPHTVLAAPRQFTLAQAAGVENIFDAAVLALHEPQGTMACRAGDTQLEVPLGHVAVGDSVRIGVRAGDILIATQLPQGISARNCLPGRILSLARQDVMVVARVNCGVELEVHLTPGAVQSLSLREGTDVWLIIKTYSCHLLAANGMGE